VTWLLQLPGLLIGPLVVILTVGFAVVVLTRGLLLGGGMVMLFFTYMFTSPDLVLHGVLIALAGMVLASEVATK